MIESDKNIEKNPDSALSRDSLEALYERSKKELVMLSEITNAMMQSLELDQVLYTILTALTSHEGLGFNRAMFFLVNERNKTLEGRMAIGPHSAEEADKIWRHINSHKLTMQDLIDSYDNFKKDPESKLNSLVKGITIPLREDMGILALTILEGMPFEINTEEAKSLVHDDIKNILNMDLFVTVPLKTRNRTLGAILVDNIFSGNPITKDNVRILNMFADHAALAIENSRLYEKTVHLSRTDWLTTLWNTRYFNEMLDEKLRSAAETGTPLGLLMADIDNFKRFNDTLGHQDGDYAIKRVADILKRFSRRSDFVCRYGGEEFSIIMSRTGKNEAQIIAERLRSEIESSFKHDDTIPEKLKLTLSIGLAIYPFDSGDKRDLIRKADIALYTAKRQGKNCTCLFSEAMTKENTY